MISWFSYFLHLEKFKYLTKPMIKRAQEAVSKGLERIVDNESNQVRLFLA